MLHVCVKTGAYLFDAMFEVNFFFKSLSHSRYHSYKFTHFLMLAQLYVHFFKMLSKSGFYRREGSGRPLDAHWQ